MKKSATERETLIEIDSCIDLSAHIVAPLFQMFGWRWAGKGAQTIGVNEIQIDLYEKFKLLNDKNYKATESGRLRVEREKVEGGGYNYNVYLSLGSVFGVPEKFDVS